MSAKPGDLDRQSSAQQLLQDQIEHRARCRASLRLGADDVARMVEEFAATHGGITMAPPAYAALSNQYHL